MRVLWAGLGDKSSGADVQAGARFGSAPGDKCSWADEQNITTRQKLKSGRNVPSSQYQ